MIDPIVVWTLFEVLRRLVPGLYLFMALYVGMFGQKTRRNIAYIILFGSFGTASYMSLNQPIYKWVPVWITMETWLTISLLGILFTGMALFLMSVDSGDIASPREVAQDYAEKIRAYADYNNDRQQ